MTLKENLVRQFENPSGVIGRIIGWLMSRSNKKLNNWAIKHIQPQPNDTILEVGYGPGTAVDQVAQQLTTGSVVGIDHSWTMYNHALKRNLTHIENRKVQLYCTSLHDIGFPQNYFDGIYATNVHFFWKHPVTQFQRLYAWLKPGGGIVIVFQPRWVKTNNELNEIADQTRRQLIMAGFKNVEVDYKNMRPVTGICVHGKK